MKRSNLKLTRTTITRIALQGGTATNSSQGGACSCEQHCEQARDTVHDCDPTVGCGSHGCDSVHDCARR